MSSETVRALQEVIKNSAHVHVVGAKTKTGMHDQNAATTELTNVTAVSTRGLRGVMAYDPQEFVITVLAGTPVSEVIDALNEHRQYLPFDPMLTQHGATIGGTVAGNAAGSGRFRFGGVRDFLLGVRFIDGRGNSIRGGGQVVKNAAGFDYPKLMVGSQGKLGLIYELTFKVFPRPEAYATAICHFSTVETALQCLTSLASSNLDVESLDLLPSEQSGHYEVAVRIGGIASAIPYRLTRLKSFSPSVQCLHSDDDQEYWHRSSNLIWAAGKSVLKMPITPKLIPEIERCFADVACARRYSVGGNVAWVAGCEQLERLFPVGSLQSFWSNGSVSIDPLRGSRIGPFGQSIKRALDPEMKFV